MALPPEFLRELEQRSPIEDIAGPYVNLKRRGKSLVGLCPFHNEKTGSFNVYPGNNSFYCFGCHKGGDVINFVMGVENLDFMEAVRWLAQRAGMQVPEQGMDDSMHRLRARILEINREAGRFYYRVLSTSEGRPGLEYFRRRGLDGAAIRRFGLGFAPEGGFALVNHLKEKGYTPQEMVQADMARLSQKGRPYDRYRGRVMFPIFDLRGNVVAFGGRILTDEKPKYINTADTPVYHKSSGLFAMSFAKDSGAKELILAEGYMDVIALHRAGFTNAIASLGTSLTGEQARIIKRYADQVVICYDADEAGRRATQRAIPILREAGLEVRVVTVPGGKDPDEFLKMYGEDGPLRFRQLLEQGSSATEYRLGAVRDKYDLETPDGRSRYLQEAVGAVLATLPSGIDRDIYAGQLSQETGVGKDSILKDVDRAAKQAGQKERRKQARAQQEVAAVQSPLNPEKRDHIQAAMAEEGLIAYLFLHQDKAGLLKQRVPPEKFVTQWNRRVYAILLGKTIYGDVSLASLAQELTREEQADLARILAERREVPPTGADMEEYGRVLETAGRYASKKELAEASVEDLKEYMDLLRRRK